MRSRKGAWEFKIFIELFIAAIILFFAISVVIGFFTSVLSEGVDPYKDTKENARFVADTLERIAKEEFSKDSVSFRINEGYALAFFSGKPGEYIEINRKPTEFWALGKPDYDKYLHELGGTNNPVSRSQFESMLGKMFPPTKCGNKPCVCVYEKEPCYGGLACGKCRDLGAGKNSMFERSCIRDANVKTCFTIDIPRRSEFYASSLGKTHIKNGGAVKPYALQSKDQHSENIANYMFWTYPVFYSFDDTKQLHLASVKVVEPHREYNSIFLFGDLNVKNQIEAILNVKGQQQCRTEGDCGCSRAGQIVTCNDDFPELFRENEWWSNTGVHTIGYYYDVLDEDIGWFSDEYLDLVFDEPEDAFLVSHYIIGFIPKGFYREDADALQYIGQLSPDIQRDAIIIAAEDVIDYDATTVVVSGKLYRFEYDEDGFHKKRLVYVSDIDDPFDHIVGIGFKKKAYFSCVAEIDECTIDQQSPLPYCDDGFIEQICMTRNRKSGFFTPYLSGYSDLLYHYSEDELIEDVNCDERVCSDYCDDECDTMLEEVKCFVDFCNVQQGKTGDCVLGIEGVRTTCIDISS